MTILNNDSLGNYVAISPLKCAFNDTIDANALTVLMRDDTVSCVVSYNLYNLITTSETIVTAGDIPGEDVSTEKYTNTAKILFSSTCVIDGDTYTNWTGDTEFVFTFTATKLGLTLL